MRRLALTSSLMRRGSGGRLRCRLQRERPRECGGAGSHAAELTDWEQAWSGVPAGDPLPHPRVFLPPLLEDRAVAVVSACQDGHIVAGAIANHTGKVVGLSNVFAPEQGRVGFWAGCVAAVMAAFPGLPVVGYEREDELAVALALGFEAMGALRVWLAHFHAPFSGLGDTDRA